MLAAPLPHGSSHKSRADKGQDTMEWGTSFGIGFSLWVSGSAWGTRRTSQGVPKMRAVLILSVLSLLAAAQIPLSPGGDPYYRVRLAATQPEQLAQSLEAAGYDADCLPMGSDWMEAILSPQEYGVLVQAGFQPVVLQTATPLTSILEDIPVGYHDLAAIHNILLAKQTAMPGICKIRNLSAEFGPSLTVEGRAIEALKISDNVLVDEDEPCILVACSHHAREITTPEEALDLIERLTAGYGVNPTLTQLINTHEIWIVPVVNPDGVNTVWTSNALWRKNRRPNGDGTFGVDLNRNYPHLWASACSGSTVTSSETYRGVSAGSEIETQTIMNLSRARRFAKVLDFHSYGREVLLSYVCSSIAPTVGAHIDAEGMALAPLAAYGTRDPSSEGEHQMFQIGEITSYAYLAEMNTSFQPAYSAATSEAAILWPLVQGFFNRPIAVSGHCRDALTGQPLAANIAVNTIAWTQGETRKSRSADGAFFLSLPVGQHLITASKAGYAAASGTVTVSASGTATLDLYLAPSTATFSLGLGSAGSAVGNLHVGMAGIPTNCTQGFTVFSLDTSLPLGQGSAFGIQVDALALACLNEPLATGGLLHWSWPVQGLFPAVPFVLPPGSLAFPPGFSVDGLGVAFGSGGAFLGTTPAVRLTF